MIHDGHDGNLFGSMHGAGGLQLEMEFVARPDPAGGMPGGPGGFHYQFSGEAWFAVTTHATLSLWQDLCITPKSEDEAEDPNDMFARFFQGPRPVLETSS